MDVIQRRYILKESQICEISQAATSHIVMAPNLPWLELSRYILQCNVATCKCDSGEGKYMILDKALVEAIGGAGQLRLNRS